MAISTKEQELELSLKEEKEQRELEKKIADEKIKKLTEEKAELEKVNMKYYSKLISQNAQPINEKVKIGDEDEPKFLSPNELAQKIISKEEKK